MKIEIMSRQELERHSTNPLTTNTAVISITDFGNDYAELKNFPDFLLQIAFDDVDNDVFEDELGRPPTKEERKNIELKYKMYSDDMSISVAEFYFSIIDKVDVLICQCEHGQSRSAAIASAILEYRGGKGINIFADDRYYPNKVVFRKTLNALKHKGGKNDATIWFGRQ